MKDISKKVLDNINTNKLKPIPKYVFALRDIVVAISAILFVLLGIISVSLIAFNIFNQDWDIYKNLNESFVAYLILYIPYLWIILSIIFIIITILNIKKSKNGYKYSSIGVILACIIIPIIAGLVVNESGLGSFIDEYLGTRLSGYKTVEDKKNDIWNQPENGLLSGEIVSVADETIIIKTNDTMSWTVEYSQANIKGNANIEIGTKIKLIGIVEGEIFKVKEIRPWGNNTQRNRHKLK